MDIPIGFTQTNCANCSLPSFVPSDFISRRRKDHAEFYCPMGHTNYFKAKNDEEILRERLANEQVESARLRRELAAAKRKPRKPRAKKATA